MLWRGAHDVSGVDIPMDFHKNQDKPWMSNVGGIRTNEAQGFDGTKCGLFICASRGAGRSLSSSTHHGRPMGRVHTWRSMAWHPSGPRPGTAARIHAVIAGLRHRGRGTRGYGIQFFTAIGWAFGLGRRCFLCGRHCRQRHDTKPKRAHAVVTRGLMHARAQPRCRAVIVVRLDNPRGIGSVASNPPSARAKRERARHHPRQSRTFLRRLAVADTRPAVPGAQKFCSVAGRRVVHRARPLVCLGACRGWARRWTVQCSMRRNRGGRSGAFGSAWPQGPHL